MKLNLVVSPSSLNTQCAQSWQYEKQFALIRMPADEPEYFKLGHAVHAMLETWYGGIKKDPTADRAALLQACIDTLRIQAVTSGIAEDAEQNLANCMMQYSAIYSERDFSPLEVELACIKQLYEDDECRILVEGKIDLVAKNTVGELVLVDHKSTARDGKKFSPLDNQVLAYSFMTGIKIFIHNIFGLQKTVSPKQKFRQPEAVVYDYMLEEWRRDVVEFGMRLIKYSRDNYFPRTRIDCAFCQFEPLCKVDSETRDKLMPLLYSRKMTFKLFTE